MKAWVEELEKLKDVVEVIKEGKVEVKFVVDFFNVEGKKDDFVGDVLVVMFGEFFEDVVDIIKVVVMVVFDKINEVVEDW